MADLSRLPPLASLRAFAAFAATGTVQKAGAMLNVSHPAISQQLRALEAHLGVALFDRSSGTLRLTGEGRRLAEATEAGFDAISRAVAELTGADEGRPVMVTTTASFASGWLIPRLSRFRAKHPDIPLMIDPTPDLRPLGPGGMDMALRYGDGGWPGVDAEQLIETGLVVVAAPSLLGQTPPGDLSALSALPWLQELGTTEADDFRHRHGIATDGGPGLTAMPGNMALDAARAGQGVAVVARAFVEPDLAAGRLVLLYEDDAREGYWLVTRPGVMRPSARTFAAWLRREARAN